MDLSALVRHRLAVERRNGRPFAEAWATAMRGLPMPHGRGELADELAALHATRSAWAAAYEGRPVSPSEKAAGRLLTILSAD